MKRSFVSPVLRASVVATLVAIAAPCASAADVLGQATASVQGLRYRLIDLDLNDGITPTMTISGGWVAGASPDTSVDSYYFDPLASGNGFMSSRDIHLLGNGGGVSAVSPNGTGSAAVGTNSFSVGAQLTSEHVVSSGSGPYTNSGYMNYLGDNRYEVYDQTITSTSLDGTARSGLLSIVPATNVNEFDPYDGISPSLITLSANTLLVMEGTASIDLALSRSAERAAKAGLPATDVSDPLHTITSELSARGRAAAELNLVIVQELGTYAGFGSSMQNQLANFSFTDALEFAGDQGFMSFVSAGELGELDLVIEDVESKTLSSSKDFMMTLSNVTGSEIQATIEARLTSEVSQHISTYSAEKVVTDEITIGTNPGGTGAIPEPGTWALFGLGLAGIAVARRKAQLRG